MADAGALPNFQVQGFAPFVLLSRDCRVGSAARIKVAVAGASVSEMVL